MIAGKLKPGGENRREVLYFELYLSMRRFRLRDVERLTLNQIVSNRQVG